MSAFGPALYVHPDLGRIAAPDLLTRSISLPGAPVRFARQGELGIFVATQKRFNEAKGLWETIWASITHNERVDRGASIQVNRVLGTVGTASNGVPSAVGVASSSLTKNKADLSLGSTSANVTTNEFTANGLARATGTVQNYAAPSTLGGTFSVDVYKSFSVSGAGGTAHGAGLFDQVVVSGSNLYVEDNFASQAVLVSGDTLNVTITIQN